MLMKIVNIRIFSLLIGLFLSGGNAVAEDGFLYEVQGEQTEYDKDSVLDRSWERYTGLKCAEDSICKHLCSNIYDQFSFRKDCLELPQMQVRNLWEIYRIFENLSEDKLADINLLDFEVFVAIDFRPLFSLIKKFKNSEAKIVWAWVMREPGIEGILKDKGDEYELLMESLLHKLHTDNQEALTRGGGGRP